MCCTKALQPSLLCWANCATFFYPQSAPRVPIMESAFCISLLVCFCCSNRRMQQKRHSPPENICRNIFYQSVVLIKPKVLFLKKSALCCLMLAAVPCYSDCLKNHLMLLSKIFCFSILVYTKVITVNLFKKLFLPGLGSSFSFNVIFAWWCS